MASERRERLRECFGDANIEVLLVTNPTNIRYLSGFTGSNGALLVGSSAADDRLATDFRYLTQSASQCPDLEMILDRQCARALIAFAGTASTTRVGFESHSTTVAAYEGLRSVHEIGRASCRERV